MKTRIVFIAVILTVVQSAWANDYGTNGARILNQAVGARTYAMGDAFTAVADDVQALHYNPAGLESLKQREIDMMYIRGILDINYGYIGYAQPMGRGVIACSVMTLQGGNIDISFTENDKRTGHVKI